MLFSFCAIVSHGQENKRYKLKENKYQRIHARNKSMTNFCSEGKWHYILRMKRRNFFVTISTSFNKKARNFFAFSSYLLFSDLYSSKWNGNGKRRRSSLHRHRKMERGRRGFWKRATLAGAKIRCKLAQPFFIASWLHHFQRWREGIMYMYVWI